MDEKATKSNIFVEEVIDKFSKTGWTNHLKKEMQEQKKFSKPSLESQKVNQIFETVNRTELIVKIFPETLKKIITEDIVAIYQREQSPLEHMIE